MCIPRTQKKGGDKQSVDFVKGLSNTFLPDLSTPYPNHSKKPPVHLFSSSFPYSSNVFVLSLGLLEHGHVMVAEVPGNRHHEWLHFEAHEEEYEKRLDALWPRRHLILAGRRLDFATMNILGQKKRWDDIVTGPWRKLFRIHQVQYVELVMEFFATYEFPNPNQDLQDSRAIRFRLGGRWMEISVARLGEILGLYTAEEIDSELFTAGIIDFPSERVKKEFWADQGVGNYTPGKTKASKFRDPLLRILHRCLVYSIAGRFKSETAINLRELFYLYCLVHPHTCNLAHVIAEYFLTSSGREATSAIFGGHLVTKIARSYELLTDEALKKLTPVAETQRMNIKTLHHMRLVKKTQMGKRLVDRWGRIWNPLRPGDDPDRRQEAQVQVVGEVAGQESHVGAAPVIPPPSPQQDEVIIPLSERRILAWMYETNLAWAAAAKAAGIHVQIPVPFFMHPPPQPPQPPVDREQHTQDGDLGGMDLDAR
ncbi:hypothetical protein M8C21_012807 [Ambrosia artemisiifolia]|uniref:Uncharacterized protein n=1 Tax=Ambrosia artemisiifolia TaxID=4212 RepID=A0AAD5C094_AMBAR|nr:hypothetical protein M8C21_012807 [Ambrosia artemisiifolia]